MEEEVKEAAAAKNETAAALDRARSEMNESMAEYRDNRTFSLKVRDLVTAGQVDEARALCVAQVDELVARLGSDAPFRDEYYHLWALQRKYAVSELLPDSTAVVKEARAEAGGKFAKGGKAGDVRGGGGARPPPPKPQGAEKARLLIEQLMAEASVEAGRKIAGRAAAEAEAHSSGDADDEQEEAGPAPVVGTLPVVEAPSKPRSSAASARPADVLKLVELPVIEDVAFVPPVIKSAAADAVVAGSEQDKQRLREEQAAKAAEAELRKKKAAESKEKKRKEADVKRTADAEVRKVEAVAAAAERVKQQAAERADAEAKRKAADAVAKAMADAKLSTNPAAKIIAKSQVTVAAKTKPQSSGTGPDLQRYWKAFKKNSQLQLALVAALLIVVLLWLMIQATR
ncbi:hypothetical protein TSOC_010449 [Tetrabaena socialis]|uniref:Uncharacterized protein n=1 Tax=Tetrabaena socialis TaxID=47790 RepID=A0A2J7ZTB1_9CHLO|nr:hypothetical protein TSOC_010449 [Tetrabaena socialis]|eukprot:PNH03498.1 hypothetical protein TSOC_010449 [Tetrabaena socialis]